MSLLPPRVSDSGLCFFDLEFFKWPHWSSLTPFVSMPVTASKQSLLGHWIKAAIHPSYSCSPLEAAVKATHFFISLPTGILTPCRQTCLFGPFFISSTHKKAILQLLCINKYTKILEYVMVAFKVIFLKMHILKWLNVFYLAYWEFIIFLCWFWLFALACLLI